MDERTLRINKLALQLQTLVELDSSLGAGYYSIPAGLDMLELKAANTLDASGAESQQPGIEQPESQQTKTGSVHLPSQDAPRANLSSVALNSEDVVLSGESTRVKKIEELNQAVSSCTDCVLSQSRKTPVRSEGNTQAEVVFVSSAPGREEDNFGRNFQGAAGQLIIDIIEKGMKIPRDKVYLSSIVKCRPPGNRELLGIEIEACIKYFEEEMKVVAPKAIVAVGAAATNILTDQDVSIEMTRGVWYEYNGIPVMPIYHPSFLLRQRRKLGHKNEYVRKTWQDIQQVMHRLSQ